MSLRSPKNIDAVSKSLPNIPVGANEWEKMEGRDYVVIRDLEKLEPFFLSLVTVGNQWFFCSSHGSLTAGRQSPETSLFPYLTVDKIHENWNVTGSQTAILCGKRLWHPFWPVSAHAEPVKRRILKSVLGDELVFEEFHRELKLRFVYRWQVSERFGFVRKAKVINEGRSEKNFRIIDGWQDIQAAGVGSRLHLELSCLADAYRTSEIISGGRLLIHRLASGIVDAPIPLESLTATTVWVDGLDEGHRFLSRADADRYLKNPRTSAPLERLRGERGAFFAGADLTLATGESREWMMVGEVNQNHRTVSQLATALNEVALLRKEVEDDLKKGQRRLGELVSSVDGFQDSGDRDATLHHYHNTLCNFLRGGLPEKGAILERDPLIRFVRQNNLEVLEAHQAWFDGLPPQLNRVELLEKAAQVGDPDLLRLVEEYLPLVLGRRHGDPSRPWNQFNILLEDEEGRPIHHYEGNWRDIFQNWEALAWSYPVYLDGFISRFLNASTIDGFNPYRVTAQGVDWEVPDKDDPWVSIGYWGDHQIIYLLKFLELKEKLTPGGGLGDLNDRRYVFADVPYILDGWEEILDDPRDTVVFDVERHRALLERKKKIGGDGLLLRDPSGEIVRATMVEKLLIPFLAKLGQLIPDGGVWMCNQKPEWNDANNALAGNGLSVVTTGYLLRYVRFLSRMSRGLEDRDFEISRALRQALDSVVRGMGDSRWVSAEGMTAEDRFELAEKNGRAVEAYRKAAKTDEGRQRTAMKVTEFQEMIAVVTEVLETVLERNRREDGLWHSYNIVQLDLHSRSMEIKGLQLMLEGQVAILSSGLLTGEQAVALLEKLSASELKSDRHPTYLLYPDRELPSFMEMNRFAESDLEEVPGLAAMASAGDDRLVFRDEEGEWRFRETLVNEYALSDALDEVGLSDDERRGIGSLYEKVFQHRSFTGRSGSMFGYEGLGCVYWHMVSKLMYAAQEVVFQLHRERGPETLKTRAANCYFEIQGGLGFRQKPGQFGAFPAEPYSHSQGRRGAQQPGLTGQVKEGILCRLGELGVELKDGCLGFRPCLLRQTEFANGELTFTQARTPVSYRATNGLQEPLLRVMMKGGDCQEFEGGFLDVAVSRKVLFEEGMVERIEVLIPADHLVS
jgi:hypothetical protein